MAGGKRKGASTDDQLLLELERELTVVMALGLVHSENTEANLARVSQSERNALVTTVESLQNIPVGGDVPDPGLKDDEIPD